MTIFIHTSIWVLWESNLVTTLLFKTKIVLLIFCFDIFVDINVIEQFPVFDF